MPNGILLTDVPTVELLREFLKRVAAPSLDGRQPTLAEQLVSERQFIYPDVTETNLDTLSTGEIVEAYNDIVAFAVVVVTPPTTGSVEIILDRKDGPRYEYPKHLGIIPGRFKKLFVRKLGTASGYFRLAVFKDPNILFTISPEASSLIFKLRNVNDEIVNPAKEDGNLLSIKDRIADLTLFGNDLSATLVFTTTPLGAGVTYTSSVFNADRYGKIVGSIFADQAGTLRVEFTNDGTNFDSMDEIAYTANTRDGFEFPVTGQTARLVFINGGTPQTVFRLYAKGRVI